MRTNPAPATDHTLDFALLQQPLPRHAGRNRRALLWLLGLLGLLVGSVLLLVLYLSNFESEEAARQRAADAQWLEQSMQFHFRRLEDDLLVFARQSLQDKTQGPGQSADQMASGSGLLWREPGVMLAQGWLPAGHSVDAQAGPARWQLDWRAHPDNAQVLALMQSTTRGLRRAAYAGLMRQADGQKTDVVWLAVPYFDRGQFAGDYVAAMSLDRAVATVLPAWFLQNHRVQLLREDAPPGGGPDVTSYRAAMNLPGTDLFLQVALTNPHPATVPRIFFLVALLFLIGMLVSLYALRRDIDKRQQVQAHLQAEVALRTAMENSVTIGLRAWDMQGTMLYVNDAFCRMVGYRASDLIGRRNPFPYWPADQRVLLERVHEDVLNQGTSDNGVEVQFLHRDGHVVDVLIHEAPLTTSGGEQIGWMSSVLDISERKRAQRMAAQQQERLEASGRLVAVGEVASTLAHELNQPLGALSSFANGLLNRLNSHSISLPEAVPVVERMARLAERAGGIIKRINAFARRRELSRQRMDLAALLQRVLASEGLSPTPTWSIPDRPVWIDADGLLLEHLVNNLLANAQDWAGQSGRVAQVVLRLQVDVAQGMAVLAVADTGPGVSDDVLETIFNAFVSHKEGGMGMGLAICRSIVEAHHGRLEVGRDAVLGGALFTVLLPLAQAPQTRKTSQEKP